MSLFLKSQLCTAVQWPPKNTNLEGRIALVTGSTSGLGLEASRQLLGFGLSELIIAVRSIEKGEVVASELRAQFPKANIRVWFLEMESYDSIQELTRRAHRELTQLDIAILNAGMQTANFDIVPATGHEKLAKSLPNQPGRLAIVNSGTARGAKIDLQCVPVLSTLDNKNRPWNPIERYAVSKLLGHLFIVNLARHVSSDHVIVNLVDPGLVKDTGLQRFAPSVVAAFFYCYKAILGRSVPVGASTYIDAVAVKGKESHGCLVANWKISS
ncbi:NAD(P)-binding protein [Daldinia eschscholtzii]|nr:NAD(P)-binding protein [Daldinia eschscholtzii]